MYLPLGGVQLVYLAIVRAIFVLILGACAYFLEPFQPRLLAGAAGLALGICIIFFEILVEQISLKRLIGAAFGSVLGIFGAFLMALVLKWANLENSKAIPFLQVLLLRSEERRVGK